MGKFQWVSYFLSKYHITQGVLINGERVSIPCQLFDADNRAHLKKVGTFIYVMNIRVFLSYYSSNVKRKRCNNNSLHKDSVVLCTYPVLDQNWQITKHLTISPLTNSSMIILLFILVCK
uniref:Uncharacterized protein n=1 Tax=Cacopsylla melanoneura TaxID=428564 RepID=A0A8D8T989_9HEMI